MIQHFLTPVATRWKVAIQILTTGLSASVLAPQPYYGLGF